MNKVVELSLPQNIRIDELGNELASHFSLEHDGITSVSRTYLDSFDWRLYRKRLLLFAETSSEGVRLILRSQGQPDTQRVLNIDSIPVFTSDISSFVFRNRLEPVLRIRALIPQLVIQSRVKCLLAVDADNKTLLYIQFENPRLALSNGQYRMLGKRIRLIPVKGYTRPAEQILRYLKKNYKFSLIGKDELDQGLELLNVEPAKYSAKLKYRLKPDMTASEALRTILLKLLEAMKLNEPGVIDDIDTEFLHDFRVAVRKTRSALSQSRHILPDSEVEAFMREFGWMGTVTGPARDMHVYLLKFNGYQAALPEDIRPALVPLREFLVRKKGKEHERLVKGLQSSRYKKLTGAWRQFLDTPQTETKSSAISKKPIKELADKQIWKVYRRVIHEGRNIRADSPDTELHRLRISCKKLRYLIEFFEDLYPRSRIRSLLESLKQLQDVLGDYHDYYIQIIALDHIKKQMSDAAELSIETGEAIDMLMDVLRTEQQDLRKQFKGSFRAFALKKNQANIESIFGQPGKGKKGGKGAA